MNLINNQVPPTTAVMSADQGNFNSEPDDKSRLVRQDADGSCIGAPRIFTKMGDTRASTVA